MMGEALPLVCVGGTLCDAHLFEEMIEAIDRDAQVWNPTGQETVCDAALALLGQVAAPCVLLGFSLGGFVVLEAMRRAPDQVVALILLSGNAFPDDPGIAATRRGDVVNARAEGLATMIMRNSEKLVSSVCPDRDRVIATIAAMAERCGHEVHARQTEMNICRPDLRETLHDAVQPILAIVGTDDQVCPPERYSQLRGSPHVQFAAIPEAGHFLPLEAPLECANRINDFLKDIG